MFSSEDTQIFNFHHNKTGFITGATGFSGKVFLEKLLRSCSELKCVYILLRSEKDKTTGQRLNELMSGEIFSKLTHRSLQKVIALAGDLNQPNLGLNFEDYQRIINNTEIVFHSAAKTCFKEPLKNSVAINLEATKSILDLCHSMKAFVHVSTAYACCYQSESKEMIYPMKISPLQMMESSRTGIEAHQST